MLSHGLYCTLAIIDGFLVDVAGGSYVLPLDLVRECVDLRPECAAQIGDAAVGCIDLHGEVLPVVHLAAWFGQPAVQSNRRSVVVVRFGEQFGRVEIALAHGLAVLVPFVAWFAGVPRGAFAASLLALLLVPLSLAILMGRDGANLNKSLAGFGAMLYLYGVVFAIGVFMSGGMR